MFFVGLDVGGTTMKAGVVDEHAEVRSAVSLPTEAPRGQEHGLERMCETIRQAVHAADLSFADIAAIGVAVPGLTDIPAGMMLAPMNLRPWANVPVRDHVHSVFGLPTAFQNDANAAALGEFWAGAGRDVSSMVFFTLGTGVGGGIVLGGKVIEGRNSHGAELGHMKIEMTRPRECGCGKFGCLEAYASATAVVKRAHEALNQDGGRSSLHAVLRATGDLTARDIFVAAETGDILAARLVEETAYYIGVGTMNMMHIIDPEMIVFGGGMIAAGEGFLARIRHYVHQLAFTVPAANTEIRYALLGTDAGFIGAAACGRALVMKGQPGERGSGPG